MAQAIIRPIVHGFIGLCYRTEVEGEENFPHDGRHVYTPTHPSVMDPPMISKLTRRDMRYMADVNLFKSRIGASILSWGGAFPVNRRDFSAATLEHAVDVVKAGKGFCIFPEGGMPYQERDGKVGPFKRGAAHIAIKGGAESVVPIAIDYQKDTEPRIGSEVANAFLSLGIAATAIAGMLLGGPARVIATTVSGALTGAYALGKTLKARAKQRKWFNPTSRFVAQLVGGIIGGAVGAVTGNALSEHLPRAAQVALGAGAGASAYKMGDAYIHRDVARIVVGQPIPVQPYVDEYGDTRAAVNSLTTDLQRTMGHMKAGLTGVPYDESAPKFLQGVVSHYGDEKDEYPSLLPDIQFPELQLPELPVEPYP
ncbi:MAG: lysophospholipid acyltransferase family protein [Candidatus Eremiobacterota bacterium]